ncbi:Polyphenol oxidase protein [Thalictrum thalictroides]|uniref:Polyphenol oxidase protein n=1 Tax=Thalictrum thalictroides TaxID=46969 RepID=A0A7J6X4S8_THATH|nr:Polyphenol oxidase protein [Thalictrum thalictroides]
MPTEAVLHLSVSMMKGQLFHLIDCRTSSMAFTQDADAVSDRNDMFCAYGEGGYFGVSGKIAMGAPVSPPDLSKCHLATDDAANGEQVYCCPPYSSADIKPFVPFTDGILRIRKPAHRLNHKEIEDFKRGIQLMKELPASDPWNFYQQATIHCTYCNGSFDQVGFPDVLLQIHGSWLFTPWHRYYLYFWEKILGKLLNDPTFAIPYWSWDQPEV